MGLRIKLLWEKWVQVSELLSLTNQMTLGKLLNLSKLFFFFF